MSTITIRADEQTERALDELTEDGVDRSAAIREAIQEAAQRRRANKLRAEAESLAADPDDRAEAAAVLADMESLRAW
ncbi:ribbon-helix-helix protein, CopG family [Actinomadura sp. BRA 177]|uniref:ribbon-helix-helix protein, CopG family n=1 Tax=Actinomadura sp. BRA 177 TaxID=2745202 RepID=UPI001595D9C3|nr:ribbon-helix-helix protein, CopG family [Actinomadura sp. BRA 177]NVI89192.1 ribbon-helix-helix protein, CopG family [Actinomadura sp. BRA 177]